MICNNYVNGKTMNNKHGLYIFPAHIIPYFQVAATTIIKIRLKSTFCGFQMLSTWLHYADLLKITTPIPQIYLDQLKN